MMAEPETIVVTALLHGRKRADETRKLEVAKERAQFIALLEQLEKLFGCKICPNQCVYADTNGDQITFSSDEELSLAFKLHGGSSFRLEIHEMTQRLAEANPSETSTAYSLNTSTASHQSTNSPPSSHNTSSTTNPDKTTLHEVATPKSSLFRTFILPKITSGRDNNIISSPAFSTTSNKTPTDCRVRKTPSSSKCDCAAAVAALDPEKNTSELSNVIISTDSMMHATTLSEDKEKLVNSEVDRVPSPMESFNDVINAILRIMLWFGTRFP